MIRCYVAGPYSANNVIDVLRNIGRGQKACARLFNVGFSPFCPWHDKSYVIDMPYSKLTTAQLQAHSMAWLEVSDCVLVLSGWEDSDGTTAEIKRAVELNIPVFFSINEVLRFKLKTET